MKKIISNSVFLYSSKFIPLICLSLLTYMPALLLHTVIVNYIYQQTRFAEYPGIIGDAANGIFMLILLTVAQLPFIKFALLDHEDEEQLLRKSVGFAMDRMFSLYLFACLYALLVFFGSMLLIIPGLLILLLFYFVPFYIADETKSYKAAMRKSKDLIKGNFLITVLTIISMTLIQLFFENILFVFLALYTDSYFVLLITKMILLVFILPFQVILVTNIFYDIKEEKLQEAQVKIHA